MGKFVTFSESYTYLALHSMLYDIISFSVSKSMSIQRQGYTFYNASLLNFKVLYLKLHSDAYPKFYIWGTYIHFIGILLSLGKTGVRKNSGCGHRWL